MDSREDQLYTQGNETKSVGIPNFFILLLLGTIIWIANFWHFADFGLYEDDWNRVPVIIGLSWDQLFSKIISDAGFQGRPFHDGLIYLFSFLGFQLGGLQYAYIIGFVITTINAFLFYLLIKRTYHHHFFTLIGTLTFCLFPADTTRDYLTHSLGIQPSLAFLLIALHCYLLGQKRLSYLVAFLCLIAYEPLFTVFFGAPLLSKKWDSKLSSELFKHFVILVTIIGCTAIARKLGGENQVSSFGIQSIALLLTNPVIGSITSLVMLVYRPIETLFHLSREIYLLCIPCLIMFGWLISRLNFNISDNQYISNTLFSVEKLSKLPDSVQDHIKPIVTGLTFLLLAYPLTMTSYGFAISGRSTRVHVAAIIGTSILSACLCSILLLTANKFGKRRIATVVIASFFTLLVGFGLRVQQDYQLMWEHQRGFWSDVVRLCPDLVEGTVIFVEPSGLRDTRQKIPFKESRGVSDPRQIKGLEWELPAVLPNLYEFPSSWKLKPRAYRLQSNWQDKILAGKNSLRVDAAIPVLIHDDIKREVISTNVILLETKNGQLTRKVGSIVIADRKIELKAIGLPSVNQLPKKHLYKYLIQNPGEKQIDYLIK